MSKQRIIQHAGKRNRKIAKMESIHAAKGSAINHRRKQLEADGNTVLDISIKRDRDKFLNQVAFNTGVNCVPLHLLLDGVEGEENKQRLFNLRETFITNAFTIYYLLERIESGKSDPNEASTAKELNQVYSAWEMHMSLMRQQIDIQEKIRSGVTDNGHG